MPILYECVRMDATREPHFRPGAPRIPSLPCGRPSRARRACVTICGARHHRDTLQDWRLVPVVANPVRLTRLMSPDTADADWGGSDSGRFGARGRFIEVDYARRLSLLVGD